MRIIKDLPQHLPNGEANPDWLTVRAGVFTASDFSQYMSIATKGTLTETAESNLYKKVLESQGYTFDSYKSPAMERGTELEPLARQEYIAETFNDVQEVGFVDWEKLRAGFSPDGLIMDGDKIVKTVEHKCPEIKNYLRMAKGDIPAQYICQVQFGLLITGAKSCDFVVWHPDMKLVVHEIAADKEYQAQIVEALEKLNARYDEILDEINKYKREV